MSKAKKKVTRTTKNRIELTGKDLLRLIRSVGAPLNAEVFVLVPGGGDYAFRDLPIDEHAPLVIQWTSTEEEDYIEEDLVLQVSECSKIAHAKERR